MSATAELIQRLEQLEARVAVLEPLPAATAPTMETMEKIQRTVAAHFGIQLSVLLSKARPKRIAVPRMIAMMLSRETGYTFEAIAEAFGKEDHGTGMHAVKAITAQMEINAHIRQAVLLLRKRLNLE